MRRNVLLMAAALAVAGMGFSVQAQTDDRNVAERAADRTERAADRTERAAERTGDRVAGAVDTDKAEDVKGTLETATEAAFTKDGFDDVVERFVDADRNRIGQSMPTDEQIDQLNAKLELIRNAWKNKYDQDFAIDDRSKVFSDQFARVISIGEIGEGARVAGERVGAEADRARTDPARVPDTDMGAADARRDRADAAGNEDEDRNREKGRDVAVVQIQQSHGMPQLRIELLKEFPNLWKIDAPDNLTGNQLYDNLSKHLDKFAAEKANWPDDVNEGYRMASHHVLAAIFEGQQGMNRDGMNRDGMDRTHQPGQGTTPPPAAPQ